ncbi:MAG: methyltransferase [Planctomycetaceae bacterium]
MSIDSLEFSPVPGESWPPLPHVPGGWRRRSVDVGWTTVELAVPQTPDALLDTPEVQEANRRDDSMPYWATVWPAAEVMSRLLFHADWPAGTDVLEIGCGLGLVGIAGLRRGWNVRLTDVDASSLAASRHNAAINGYPAADVRRLDWRSPPDRRYSVILACDVLYEVRHHAPVLDMIDSVLSADGCCWLGDPGRTPIVEFYQSARERGFEIVIRDCDGDRCSFPVRGQFLILELTRPE